MSDIDDEPLPTQILRDDGRPFEKDSNIGQKTRVQLERDRNRDRVCRMRLKGFPFAAIAKHMGTSVGNVSKLYKEAMKESSRESSNSLLVGELARLDDLWLKAYKIMVSKAATVNDTVRLTAISTMTKVSKERSTLIGFLENRKKAKANSLPDMDQAEAAFVFTKIQELRAEYARQYGPIITTARAIDGPSGEIAPSEFSEDD